MLKKFQLIENKIKESPAEQSEIMIFVNPNENEKKYLISDLLLDEHTLNSVLDPDELSRLEFEPEHLAVIFKKPKNYSHQDEFLFKVNSLGLFLFKKKLIIVIPDEILLFNGKLFSSVKSIEELFLKILYRTVYHYFDHLKVVNMISDSLEQKINQSLENKYLLNLFSLEKSLVYYLNAINANFYVIEKLKANSEKIGFLKEHIELLEDLIIENNQCYKQAEIYSNILSSLMDARVSIVSNNLNVLMKTLNIITIAIMVPTLVVSAFSMNLKIPLAAHPFAFWIVIGLSLSSVLTFFMIWRYKKW